MIYTVEVTLDDGATEVFDVLAASPEAAIEEAEQDLVEMMMRPASSEILEQAVA